MTGCHEGTYVYMMPVRLVVQHLYVQFSIHVAIAQLLDLDLCVRPLGVELVEDMGSLVHHDKGAVIARLG